MPDTKRGRERTGRGKEEQRRAREIERELAETNERERPEFQTPMKVLYTVDWDPEQPRTLYCEGFEELTYGVVLYDSEGEEIGYVSHENLVAIEPE